MISFSVRGTADGGRDRGEKALIKGKGANLEIGVPRDFAARAFLRAVLT
jgi:hypothetical protein